MELLRRFGVREPNITPWRRSVCGDLTSAFDFARTDVREPRLAEQLQEDAAHYRGQGACGTLVGFVYDPEGLLRDPQALAAWARPEDDLVVRCVVGAFG